MNTSNGSFTSENAALNGGTDDVIEDIIAYRNCSIQPLNIKGSSTKDGASSAVNFLVSTVGLANTYVSIFGAAMSALDIFEQDKGPVYYGNQGDWCYISLFYDKLVKNSYVSLSGTRFLGCTSQKVWIARSSAHQYYSSVGTESLVSRDINRTFYTESWFDSKRVAIYNWTETHVDSPITAKINYSTAVF